MMPSISSLRRRAAKLGWSFHRSNWRRDSLDNMGEFMLVDGSRRAGTVIEGDRYNATLEDVARRIEAEEGRLIG